MAMADPGWLPVDEAAHRAARRFMLVTTPLLALAIGATVARVVVRARSPLRFRCDDGLIVFGCSVAAANWALLCYGIVWFAHPSVQFASPALTQRVIEFGVLSAVLWAACVLCIKLSVALTLLRFVQHRVWRHLLNFILTIVVLTGLLQILFPLVQCQPLAAVWDPSVTGAKCWGPQTFRILSNCGGFINMTTDLILSLYPLTFLYQLRRPTLEKALVFFLMGTGITASAASIIKMLYVTVWVHATMTFSVGFTITMLSCVEIFIGITAACLPSLKSTMHRVLGRWRAAPLAMARPGFIATSKGGPVGTINDPHGPVTLRHGSMVLPHRGVTLESTIKDTSVSMLDLTLEEKRTWSSTSGGGSSREAGDPV